MAMPSAPLPKPQMPKDPTEIKSTPVSPDQIIADNKQQVEKQAKKEQELKERELKWEADQKRKQQQEQNILAEMEDLGLKRATEVTKPNEAAAEGKVSK